MKDKIKRDKLIRDLDLDRVEMIRRVDKALIKTRLLIEPPIFFPRNIARFTIKTNSIQCYAYL